MNMQIFEVAEKYKKYPVSAYVFVFEVLDWIDIALKKKHLTGEELSLSAYAYSIEKYGLLARTIWEEMNIHRSEDLGEIVFHLVEEGLMGRQETDRIEDFNNILTLDAFDNTTITIKRDEVGVKSTADFRIIYTPPTELKLKKN